jgi:hypothetical protein
MGYPCLSLSYFLQWWDQRSHCWNPLHAQQWDSRAPTSVQHWGPQVTVQEWPKVIVQRQCFSLAWVHIVVRMTYSTTMTYEMWCEEYPWNVSVLQRVHLYSHVIFCSPYFIAVCFYYTGLQWDHYLKYFLYLLYQFPHTDLENHAHMYPCHTVFNEVKFLLSWMWLIWTKSENFWILC